MKPRINPINVGLLGIGTVGGGTWEVLSRNADEIQRRAGRAIRITHVADKEVEKATSVVKGKAKISADAFEIVRGSDVEIVIELIGGTTVAKDLVLEAIRHGKHVVTADPEHRVPHLAFQPDQLSDEPVLAIDQVETSCYLRMRVLDEPGVLADIARTLADSKISIEAMVQKEPGEGERQVDIVLLTNRALEKNVNQAIGKIERLPTVVGALTRIRLEPLL
jgi:UTP:GlnB (protein PII) uridylyltransferase